MACAERSVVVHATRHRRAARAASDRAFLGGAFSCRTALLRGDLTYAAIRARIANPVWQAIDIAIPADRAAPRPEWSAEHRAGLQPRRTARGAGHRHCRALSSVGVRVGLVGHRSVQAPPMITPRDDALDADILIIGAGGAGLLAALHAHEPNPNLQIRDRRQGTAGAEWMHPDGAGRLQRRARTPPIPSTAISPIRSRAAHGSTTRSSPGGWSKRRRDASLSWKTRSGCLFDRNPDGTIHQKPFAGQSFDRTVHQGDLTGIEIMSNLRDYILESDISACYRSAADWIARGRRTVAGALLLDIRAGRLIAVRAKATSAGHRRRRDDVPHFVSVAREIRRRHGAWPGGQAPAFVDMEMLQFHPTGLLVGESIADRRTARRRAPRRRRAPVQRTGRALHGAVRPSALGAGHARRRLALELSGDRRRPRDAARRRLHRCTPPRRGISAGEFPRHGRAVRRLWVRPAARSRRSLAQRALPDGRHRTSTSTAAPNLEVSSRRAKTRAACMAPTAWAATA